MRFTRRRPLRSGRLRGQNASPMIDPSMSSRHRRHAGQLAIAGFAGHSIPSDLRALAQEFDLGGIILFARNVESPGAGGRDRARGADARARAAALGQRRSGRRAGRPAAGAVHAVAADADARAERRRAAGGAVCRALAAELRAVGVTLDFTPVLDILTNPKNPGDRRSRAGRNAPRTSPGSGRSSSGRCRQKASPPAASTFPGTAIRAPTRITSCRSSSIRPIGWRRSSSCRSGQRLPPASPVS